MLPLMLFTVKLVSKSRVFKQRRIFSLDPVIFLPVSQSTSIPIKKQDHTHTHTHYNPLKYHCNFKYSFHYDIYFMHLKSLLSRQGIMACKVKIHR